MPRRYATSTAIACVLTFGVASSARVEARRPTDDAVMLPNGLALPYPTLRVFRGFGRCLGHGKRPEKWTGPWKSHEHEGLDLGGLGPDGGLGSAVRSLTRARVVDIARTVDDPPRYGYPDEREGTTTRGDDTFPRRFTLAGYGPVAFFTRAKGYWRTGNMVVTIGVGGALDGHEIRYLHLGAARPDLVVGSELAPGEELGVLGGTAVQDAAPHVHIDIRDPNGESVDVAALIGLLPSAWCGVPRQRALSDAAAFRVAAAALPGAWRPDAWAPPIGVTNATAGNADARVLPTIDLLRTPAALVTAGLVGPRARFWHDTMVPPPCGPTTVEEDFSSGAYAGHTWHVATTRKDVVVDVAAAWLDGPGAPALALVDAARAQVVASAAASADARGHLGGTAEEAEVEVLAPTDASELAKHTKGYRLTVTVRCTATVKSLSQVPSP